VITLAELIHDVKNLGPLPQVAVRLAAVAADPDSKVSEAVDVVRYDEALTVHILRYANSVASASRYRIETVRDAIIRLGTAKVLMAAMDSVVKNRMMQELSAYGYRERELWRHSVASSLAAECFAQKASVQLPPVLFTAALLHDIGKLVLARYLTAESVAAIWKLIDDAGLSYSEAESKVLGYNHADVGAEITAKWGLPEEITESIRLHHKPEERVSLVTDAVHISNLAAKTSGIGLGVSGLCMRADRNACERLGLTRGMFEAACTEVLAGMKEIEKQYG